MVINFIPLQGLTLWLVLDLYLQMHVRVLGSQALMKVHFMRIAPPPYFVKKKNAKRNENERGY